METSSSMQVYAGQTIAQLNDLRRLLLLEVRDLRKKQADSLNKVYKEVFKDHEDIAENYFHPGNDSNGNYFSQRLEACVRAMRIEIKRLEESVGAQLGEIEEELESSFVRLAAKEKELDHLKSQFQGSAINSKEYKEFVQKLLQKLPHANTASADESKVRYLLEWKSQYEARLEEIIDHRTAQLQKEISISQGQLGLGVTQSPDASVIPTRHKRMEHIAQAVNKVIDGQLQSQHQIIDSERDRLLKQHFIDQMALHKSFVNKYNTIKAANKEEEDIEKRKKGYHQNPLRLQQQQSIHGVQASVKTFQSSNVSTPIVTTHLDGTYVPTFLQDGKSWRMDLVDKLESHLVESASLLADAHDEHDQWINSMTQPVTNSASTLEDLLAQKNLPIGGYRSNRRASASLFTDADTLLSDPATSSLANQNFPNSLPQSPLTTDRSCRIPKQFTFSSTPDVSSPAAAPVPEKMVSKQYEDIVIKLATMYNRYNDGQIVPFTPQNIAEIHPESGPPVLSPFSPLSVKSKSNNNSGRNSSSSRKESPEIKRFYRKL